MPTPSVLEERDDDALMLLAASGSAKAFEALVTRHLPRVTRYCVKFLGDPIAGEDLAQDVLVEVWERCSRYRAEGRFLVFLLTLARNRCLNRQRGDRRRAARTLAAEAGREPDPAAGAAPGQLDALLEAERRWQVMAALVDLPPLQREALLLRFDQELSYPEIAAVVGRSEEAIRSRVHHGLRMLRAQVAGGEG